MNRPLIIRPEAQIDISEAYSWYDERNEGLGLQFAKITDACLESIRRNPQRYPRVYKHIQRALLKRFPFAVFFLVRSEAIIVVGCIHVRRSPRLWKKRL